MTTASPLPGSPVQITSMAVQGLASDTTLAAGYASASIDCTALDAFDLLIGGRIRLGTGLTTNRQFELYAYCSYDGTEFTGGFSGSAGAATPSNKNGLKLLDIIDTIATSSKDYHFGTYGLAQYFGGWLPPKVGLWLTQNTGGALDATAGNHKFWYIAQKAESA